MDPANAAEAVREVTMDVGEGADIVMVKPALVAALGAASWPGNVRQLENTIARLAALAHDATLTAADFLEQRGHEAPALAPAAAPSDDELPAEGGPSLREQVEAFERGVIARALAATGGNQSEAARRLGTSRVTLIDKIKKYGLGGR